MIFSIAVRELRSLFLSPLAWSILAITHAILAYLFLVQLDLFIQLQAQLSKVDDAPGITEIIATPLIQTAAFILMLVIPLLTMRLISEERRNKTLILLLSSPVSMTSIVIGKYLGICGFIVIQICLISLFPAALLLGGNLDYGLLASAFMGLLLLLGSFAAAGLFFSTLTEQPTVAAVSTFGFLLLLWILDWASNNQVNNLLSNFSLLNHFDPLLKGVFDSRDIIYYLLFISLFVILSIRRLDSLRLQS